MQWLVQWFTVSGQHRQTISFTPAQSFAVGKLSGSDPVYHMVIRDGPYHSSTEDPRLKTLHWDSQALCEIDWDESCFLTCGERRCWNLSSQLLLYCDILHSNFPYLTESDASLISTELRSQFRHLLPQYVDEICTLCCSQFIHSKQL